MPDSAPPAPRNAYAHVTSAHAAWARTEAGDKEAQRGWPGTRSQDSTLLVLSTMGTLLLTPRSHPTWSPVGVRGSPTAKGGEMCRTLRRGSKAPDLEPGRAIWAPALPLSTTISEMLFSFLLPRTPLPNSIKCGPKGWNLQSSVEEEQRETMQNQCPADLEWKNASGDPQRSKPPFWGPLGPRKRAHLFDDKAVGRGTQTSYPIKH